MRIDDATLERLEAAANAEDGYLLAARDYLAMLATPAVVRDLLADLREARGALRGLIRSQHRVRAVTSSVPIVALERDPDDPHPCWCDYQGRRPHDEACERAATVLAPAGAAKAKEGSDG